MAVKVGNVGAKVERGGVEEESLGAGKKAKGRNIGREVRGRGTIR